MTETCSGGGDFQAAVDRILQEGGCPQALTDVARQVVKRLRLAADNAESWIRSYLPAEITAFSQALSGYRFALADGHQDAITLRGTLNGRPSDPVHGIVGYSAPYISARLLYYLYAERAIIPPFPSLDMVAEELGVAPEKIADAIRIATFLPPKALLEAGVPWPAIAGLEHDVLCSSALCGAWEDRLACIKGELCTERRE